MVTNEYGIRFTEEKYATKNEVIKDLKITMIEPIWSQVLKYRINYNNYLTIKNALNEPFVFCQCQNMENKLQEIKNLLIKAFQEAKRIFNTSQTDFDEMIFKRILQSYSKFLKIPSDEGSIINIVKGFTQAINFDNKLVSYFDTLKYLYSYEINYLDESFVLEIYKKLTNNPNLTSAYRFDDAKHKSTNVFYDRSYENISSSSISDMMNNLYDFIQNDDEAYVLKSFICYFYVLYVKPFPSLNEEMATLLSKSVLSLSEIGNNAFKVPLEKIVLNNYDDALKIINEVKRTNDITYFVNHSCVILKEELQKIIDFIYNYSSKIMKDDYYKQDEEIKIEETKIIDNDVALSNTHQNIQNSSSFDTISTSNPIIATNNNKSALAFIPGTISDEEALKLETYLRESDPFLSKKQARFYARHCTLGKMYTISQFKEYNKCVYETARASMDGLVELKYYKKMKIKNKFVYTPIERK